MTPTKSDDTATDDAADVVIYHDYVCPTHGTIATISPGDNEGDAVATDVRCAKVAGEGQDAQVCGQIAAWRARKGEMASVAHPSGGEAPGVVPPQP